MSQPFVWLCEGKFVITIFYNCPLYSFSIACYATGEQKATVVRTEQEAGIVKFYKHFFRGRAKTNSSWQRAIIIIVMLQRNATLTWPSLSLSAFDRNPSQILSITSCVSVFFSLPAGHPRRSQIFCRRHTSSNKGGKKLMISVSLNSYALNHQTHLNCYLEILFVNFPAVIYIWACVKKEKIKSL